MAESSDFASSVSPLPHLEAVKSLLTLSYMECSERGLLCSAQWCIELAQSLLCQLPEVPQPQMDEVFAAEYIEYSSAKALYDMREFKRAAHTLQNCVSKKSFFLRCYCLYLDGEKQKEDNTVDAIGDTSTITNTELPALRRALMEREKAEQLDGYGYYLYGVVLKELRQTEEAQRKFLLSCQLTPLLWATWLELATGCKDREELYSLPVPDHWMKLFYLAAGSLELHLNEEALGYYLRLVESGFQRSTYLSGQLALAYYNLKEFSKSLEQFQSLQSRDQYRLTNMDVYSHILFVKEMLPELTMLAQNVVNVDRYRFESLCAIANLYSLRGEHEKAVTYFEMAVKVNLSDQSVWVLLGHEYLELKNLTMSVEAYSKAIEVNKKDYRGYYGLGQAYELMKVPNLALYFYMRAHQLKPNDSRMLVALGDCYHTLGRLFEAKKCFKHAIGIGDYDQTAVVKLAQLHEALGEHTESAKLYARFVAQTETQGGTLLEELSKACTYLAKYHLEQGSLEEAEGFAERASKLPDTQAEGKSLLNEIALCRAKKNKTMSQQQQQQPEMAAGMHLLDFEISPIT